MQRSIVSRIGTVPCTVDAGAVPMCSGFSIHHSNGAMGYVPALCGKHFFAAWKSRSLPGAASLAEIGSDLLCSRSERSLCDAASGREMPGDAPHLLSSRGIRRLQRGSSVIIGGRARMCEKKASVQVAMRASGRHWHGIPTCANTDRRARHCGIFTGRKQIVSHPPVGRCKLDVHPATAASSVSHRRQQGEFVEARSNADARECSGSAWVLQLSA